jgi:D-3-phosphoglycerate dehydrogenase
VAKYTVFVADSLSDEGLAVFDQYPDIEVVKETGLKGEELAAKTRESDAVLIRSAVNYTAAELANPGKCKVIGRAGIGVDNVDIAAATEAGVIVMNTPGGNSVTTAEHSLAMLFAVARTLPQAHAKLAQGNWDKKAHKGVELYNKTLGVVGLGNIGRIVADRAKGLKMKVIGYDPYVSKEKAEEYGIELVDLDGIFDRSDFISLHIPLTDATKNLVNAERMKQMKPTARIVNCARGGIVDEDALVEALDAGEIAGAALDVFAQEPLSKDSPLVGHPKVVTTPHLGASTHEAQVNVAVQVAEQVAEFLTKGDILNAVNAPALSGETVAALGAHMQLARILGHMQLQLLDSGYKKVTVRLQGDFVRHDIEPVVRAALVGLLDGTVEQAVNTINVREVAKARGIEIEVNSAEASKDYSASIAMEVHTDNGSHELVGAVFGDDEIRLVRFGEYQLEGMTPEGCILAVQNGDQPGVVGAVGTLLGEEGINIARLQVSRNRNDGQAMMFFQVDSDITDEQKAKLEALGQVQNVQVLTL